MAILPVHQMIDKPDYIGSVREGLQFGQQQRALREKRADAQALRGLAPGVIQGDPAAFSQAAVIDPAAAGAYQGAGDSQMRRIEGLINLMDSAEKSGNPEYAQRMWQEHGVPFARQFSQGAEPTANWAEAKPMVESLRAKIAMAKSGSDPAAQPTGFRELDMKARAAGLQPGTAEYQKAMKVGLGLEARPSSAGGQVFKFTDNLGRERVGVFNPRTLQLDLPDGTSYNPQTGQMAPTAPETAAPADGAMVGPATESGQPVSAEEQRIAQMAAQAAARGEEFRYTVPTGGAGDAFTGRPAEQQAGLTTAAQEEAKLRYLPEQERIKTDAAIQQATGTERAKAGVEAETKIAKRSREATEAVAMLDDAEALLNKATGSLGGYLFDTVAGAVGQSTEGAQATAGLQALAGQIIAKMPRMEGPQSNYDVQLYTQMAGDIANPRLPRETRLAALQVVRRLQEKYANSVPAPAATQAPTDIDALLDKYRD